MATQCQAQSGSRGPGCEGGRCAQAQVAKILTNYRMFPRRAAGRVPVPPDGFKTRQGTFSWLILLVCGLGRRRMMPWRVRVGGQNDTV